MGRGYRANRRDLRQQVARDLSVMAAANDSGPSYDGEPAVVTEGNTGRSARLDMYYGGQGSPDGEGHGHVVSNDGENVNYWREPGQSSPSIDDRSDNPYGYR